MQARVLQTDRQAAVPPAVAGVGRPARPCAARQPRVRCRLPFASLPPCRQWSAPERQGRGWAAASSTTEPLTLAAGYRGLCGLLISRVLNRTAVAGLALGFTGKQWDLGLIKSAIRLARRRCTASTPTRYRTGAPGGAGAPSRAPERPFQPALPPHCSCHGAEA
jgi:hypothetical protein